jgi:hypothetical protein
MFFASDVLCIAMFWTIDCDSGHRFIVAPHGQLGAIAQTFLKGGCDVRARNCWGHTNNRSGRDDRLGSLQDQLAACETRAEARMYMS